MRVSRFEWNGRDAAEMATSLRSLAPSLSELSEAVATILDDVRERGDEALAELTARFDATERPPASIRVEVSEIRAAVGALPPDVLAALEAARIRIDAVARAQLADDRVVEMEEGHTVTVRELPVRSAGIYAPGGRGAYPSTVLMGCVPALAAGVERVAVVSPPGPDGRVSEAVLAACELCGVEEVYAVGGAQAIAALAYGTDSIAPVDVIAGPGNRYVQEAKRLLAGRVGIDLVAGPSELMVIADASARSDWVALDLCAQAEHGDDGLLVVAAPDESLLDRVEGHVASLAGKRDEVCRTPLALVSTARLDDTLALADALAPEHLQLMCTGADEMARRVSAAGCVLVGPHAGTAFADYQAGSNHILPTGGAARFSGPLGPGAFRRRMSVVSIPAAAAAALAPQVDVLARAEGFPVHGESATVRAQPSESSDL